MGPAADPRLNRTEGFYRGEHPSLFWELTVCQSLADPAGPYAAALEERLPYGALVARFLRARLGWEGPGQVVEVGGGYGTLMEAFSREWPPRRVTMVDLSPRFLAEQRRRLGRLPGAAFVEADARAYLAGLARPVDLVIANEIVGDFPTAVGLRRDRVLAAGAGEPADPVTAAVAERVRRYGIDLSDAPETLAFNLGAVEFLEALAGKARAVFLTEHSSDVRLPDPYGFLPVPEGDGYPRRVPLKDHDEYTVRFGHLEAAARALGFRVRRFHLAEVVGLRRDEGLRFMARTGVTLSETAEAVREFCEHIAEYQGLLLTAEGEGNHEKPRRPKRPMSLR
ncbi:methyltransferase domain-containing protein [Deferrisoma sp.]